MTRSAAARQPVDLDSRRQAAKANPKPPEAPLKPAGPVVKQRDIQHLAILRAEVEALKKKLDEANKLEQEASLPILLAMSTPGFIVEPGPLVCAIKVEPRRIPKWKEEFIKVLGEDAAALVAERTEPTIIKRLVISGAI